MPMEPHYPFSLPPLPLPYDAVYSLLKGGSAPGKDG